jgi:pentatricopeptide repeat protein
VQLLDVMDELHIPKTLLIYNTLLTACSKAREVVQAKNLLVQMRKNGIPPNIMSYNSVMSACASTSRWKDALAVLDQCHRAPGVAPDVYTYTIAMRACAKGM